MSFCILRTKKLKTISAVARSARHTFREDATPNADPIRTPTNRLVGQKSSSSLIGALRALLPEKRRKDAVLAIEYLVTASPEFFHGEGNTTLTRSSFFNAALEFLRLKHGQKNIISAAVHLDETTPHLVVYAVPLNATGKLCAKDFLGGRAKLSQLQTDFHGNVGSRFGLKRGVQGSRAKHQDVKKFYAAIQVQPELKSLSPLDKVAEAFGIKTAAVHAREQQESALLAHSQVYSRKSMMTVKKDQIRLAEVANFEKRRAAAISDQMVQESKSMDQVQTELEATKIEVKRALQMASDYYNRNQHLRLTNTVNENSTQTKNHYVPKNGKPPLAR